MKKLIDWDDPANQGKRVFGTKAMPEFGTGWRPGEWDKTHPGKLSPKGPLSMQAMAGWADATRGNLDKATIALQNGLAKSKDKMDDLADTTAKLAVRPDGTVAAGDGVAADAKSRDMGEFAWGMIDKARERIGDRNGEAAGRKFAGAMAQGTQDAYSAIINATGNKQTEKMGMIVKNGDEANGTLKDILKAIESGGYTSVSSFGPGL